MKRAAKAKQESHAAVAEALRRTGARITFARIRIMSLLKDAAIPLSHAEIEAQLDREGLPMNRVTLYRVLDWLAESGFAHKTADGRGVFRYLAAKPDTNHAQHVHFRCLACGGVYCLDAPAPRPPRLPSGFHLTKMNLEIQGECVRCAHKKS